MFIPLHHKVCSVIIEQSTMLTLTGYKSSLYPVFYFTGDVVLKNRSMLAILSKDL